MVTSERLRRTEIYPIQLRERRSFDGHACSLVSIFTPKVGKSSRNSLTRLELSVGHDFSLVLPHSDAFSWPDRESSPQSLGFLGYSVTFSILNKAMAFALHFRSPYRLVAARKPIGAERQDQGFSHALGIITLSSSSTLWLLYSYVSLPCQYHGHIY